MLERARARRSFPELTPLFTPLTHWAYVAGLPAAALALIFALTSLPHPVQQVVADGGLATDSGLSVRVYKVNGQVVFEGDGLSQIRRSNDPGDFSAATPLDGSEGRFVDPQNGSDVVFYRIE